MEKNIVTVNTSMQTGDVHKKTSLELSGRYQVIISKILKDLKPRIQKTSIEEFKIPEDTEIILGFHTIFDHICRESQEGDIITVITGLREKLGAMGFTLSLEEFVSVMKQISMHNIQMIGALETAIQKSK